MNEQWIDRLPAFIRNRIDGRYTLQKILSNASWLVADRVLRMGIGLLIGVWVARYLGPQQFGLLNYVAAFVTLFSPLSTLGLDSLVVRDFVQANWSAAVILGTTFGLKLAGATVALGLALAGSYMLAPHNTLSHWLTGILATGLVFQAFDSIDLEFQARIQSKYTVYAKNGAFLFGTVLRIAGIQLQAPLIAFAWIGLIELGAAALALVLVYHWQGQSMQQWRFSFTYARSLLQKSWLLMLAGVSVIIYMKIDQIMLKEMVGETSVGFYSAALRISEAWYFVPMALSASVFPAIVELKRNDPALYYARLQSYFNSMTRIAYAIALPTTLLSSPIIQLLFGAPYAAAAPILTVHIWASVFVFLGVAQESWNISENLLHLVLYRCLIGAVVNVLLNLVLIPPYAGLGAAIATVLSYAFASVFSNLLFRQTRPILVMQLKSLLFLQ